VATALSVLIVTAAAIGKKVLVGFDLTAVVMKCFIIWGIMPCSPQTISRNISSSSFRVEGETNNPVVKQMASSARSYIPEGRVIQAGT
jgi:hypothetical protein